MKRERDKLERNLGGIRRLEKLPDAVRYLNSCTTPDEAVLLTWAAPEYYYFAKRRFGAGHALFLPPDAFTGLDDQRLMLARMRADP